MFHPKIAIHAGEDDGKASRPHHDESDHGGDAHGGAHAFHNQIMQGLILPGTPAEPNDRCEEYGEADAKRHSLHADRVGSDQTGGYSEQPGGIGRLIHFGHFCIAQHGQDDGANRAQRTGFGWRCQAQHNGTENQEDQHGGGDDAPHAFDQQWPARKGPWHRRQILRTDDGEEPGIKREKRNLQQRRPPGAEVHIAHGPTQLVSQHHQHQRWRHQLRDGAGCG